MYKYPENFQYICKHFIDPCLVKYFNAYTNRDAILYFLQLPLKLEMMRGILEVIILQPL